MFTNNYGSIKVIVERMVYEFAIKSNKNIPESWNKINQLEEIGFTAL